MVLAKLGVIYNPIALLVCVLLLGLCSTALWRLYQRRRNAHLIRLLFYWSVGITIATLIAYLRFQLDPIYLQGILNETTYNDLSGIPAYVRHQRVSNHSNHSDCCVVHTTRLATRLAWHWQNTQAGRVERIC